MKNTSLLLLLGNAKRRPSVEPPEAHWVKRHACSGGYRGRRVAPPNRQLSLVTQKRVTFLAFFPTCSYIAKVTPPSLRGVSLRTFVLICYLEVTFHVKHCKSKLKIVYIIPVRIKKRKVKKGGIFPLSATHDFIPIFFIFFISKFSLYMIFRFLQFSCTK